jgi:hypothetical protein
MYQDRDDFRRSREAAFGCTLEEHCADRLRWLGEFAAVTAPLEARVGRCAELHQGTLDTYGAIDCFLNG